MSRSILTMRSVAAIWLRQRRFLDRCRHDLSRQGQVSCLELELRLLGDRDAHLIAPRIRLDHVADEENFPIVYFSRVGRKGDIDVLSGRNKRDVLLGNVCRDPDGVQIRDFSGFVQSSTSHNC